MVQVDFLAGLESLTSELLPAAAALLTASNLLLPPAALLLPAAESSALAVTLGLVGAKSLLGSGIGRLGGSVVVSGSSGVLLLVVSRSRGRGCGGRGRGGGGQGQAWGSQGPRPPWSSMRRTAQKTRENALEEATHKMAQKN